jgi:hypothetical protein
MLRTYTWDCNPTRAEEFLAALSGETQLSCPMLHPDVTALPVLTELLHDPAPMVRQLAIQGLEHIGPPAKSVFVDLLRRCDDDDEWVPGFGTGCPGCRRFQAGGTGNPNCVQAMPSWGSSPGFPQDGDGNQPEDRDHNHECVFPSALRRTTFLSEEGAIREEHRQGGHRCPFD